MLTDFFHSYYVMQEEAKRSLGKNPGANARSSICLVRGQNDSASDDTISLARLARLGILSTILIHDLQSGLDSVPRGSQWQVTSEKFVLVIDELYV